MAICAALRESAVRLGKKGEELHKLEHLACRQVLIGERTYRLLSDQAVVSDPIILGVPRRQRRMPVAAAPFYLGLKVDACCARPVNSLKIAANPRETNYRQVDCGAVC